MRKKNLISIFAVLFLFITSVAISSERPKKTSAEKMPDNVKAIIDKSCFGCHNTDSKNEDAKEALDFKKLDGLSSMKKISAYKHIGETVEENEMPPKKFLQNYPDKALTDKEKKELIAWAKKEAETLVKNR
jgi:uncharacterized membrane protein